MKHVGVSGFYIIVNLTQLYAFTGNLNKDVKNAGSQGTQAIVVSSHTFPAIVDQMDV